MHVASNPLLLGKTRVFIILKYGKTTIFLLLVFVLLSVSLYYLVNKYTYSTYFRALIPFTTQTTISSKVSTKPQKIFYGVNIEMSQILPGSKNYIVNSKGEDLIDVASKLGINIFRITNSTGIDSKNTAMYSQKQWDTVLNKMQKKNIKALILIESPTIYQKYITSDYLPFVKKYVIRSGVLLNPDVYGVDLYNEPVINSYTNIAQMKNASAMIKSEYPKTNVTVGWWATDTFQKDRKGKEIYDWDNYRAGTQLNSFIDFYAIHMYGFDKPTFGIYPDPYTFTQIFLNDVENGLQTNKPILIEEFGAANGDTLSDQDTLGSPHIQENTYQGVYEALTKRNDKQIIGAVAYQFISRVTGPDAWAIAKNNGNYLFPAAYILQNYAKQQSN